MSTKTAQKNSVKKGSTKGNVNASKEVKVAQMSKRTVDQLKKTVAYDETVAGTFDALLQAGRDADLENLSFGKKINHFIDVAVNRLNGIMKPEKLERITFKNVKAWKDDSDKYKGLEYVSTHQAKLIVNGYIKSIDGNVARGERVAKQGGVTGKNADKQVRRGANTK